MNFESKTLGRKFDSVLFVEDVSKEYVKPAMKSAKEHPKIQNERDPQIKIEPLSNGITVAQAYKDKNDLNGKTVTIKGKVTKYNPEIMDRNWIHLQDGTINGTDYDILVTSKDVASLGEVIVATGKLALDRDFGAGYKYSVVIEDATIAREQ